MKQSPFSLYELNSLVKQTLKETLHTPCWVQAELSEVRINYAGHCYVEFIQKEEGSNALLAKARGNIWKNVFQLLKPYFEQETGQPFVAGIKVLVEVVVDFHELYGYSLTIVDIDPTYTLGDMARQRREILRRLEEEGVLHLNKELDFPLFAQRIAVISSATAAGYGDFCHQLRSNPYGFVFYPRLFPAVMQGDSVEISVIDALNTIYAQADNWDAVVIIRGGGATSDLSGFDTYDLAVNCAQFPLPIITGIGHERDDTVLDSVAHTKMKTPTAAAEFLIEHLREVAENLENVAAALVRSISERIREEKERLSRLTERIPIQVSKRLDRELFRQERLARRMLTSVKVRLEKEEHALLQIDQRLDAVIRSGMEKERHRLDLWEQQVKAVSPELLFKRGYSITLWNGKAVTDAARVKPGDRLETRVMYGKITSTVTE